MIETIDDLYAHCDLVQDNINRAFASNRDFFYLTLAIEDMELVIRCAIGGEAPDASTWGALRASDFLQIVQDVTSWALTNFEAFKARPAAEELPHAYQRHWQSLLSKGAPASTAIRLRRQCQNPVFGQRPCPSVRGALVGPCVTGRVAPLL